jgi:hypothetical protein
MLLRFSTQHVERTSKSERGSDLDTTRGGGREEEGGGERQSGVEEFEDNRPKLLTWSPHYRAAMIAAPRVLICMNMLKGPLGFFLENILD